MRQITFRKLVRPTATCAAFGMLFAGVARGASSTPAVQSPAELQTMFDQGLYPEMLAKLNASMSATSETDKGTRYKLLMLKGEGLLRTKASDSAIDAFKAAALAGPDDHSIAIARANAALIKHSTLGKYQPKTKPATGTAAGALPAAIDIVDPASRKYAFAALFTDLMTSAKPQVDKAEKMTTLPPIMEVATQLADLRPVEMAGTESDTESKELLKKLGDHASTLMTTAVKNLDAQIATITKKAAARQKQEKVKANSSAYPDVLLPDDVSNLDAIASQAEQIGSAAVSMQTTFGDAETFKTVESDARKTVDSVNKLLKQYKHPAAS